MIARLLWLLFLLAPATFAERISYTVERPLVVGVLLFDGFEMLDVFGPLEMFSSLDARVRIVTIAAKAGPVHPRNGPAVMAEQSLAEAGALDLFLIPGGFGTRGAVNDAVLIAGIKRLSQQAPQVATVCTGAALLARTGLLDGRRATTNKQAFQWVVTQGVRTRWVGQARWVEDGKFASSSGVSAGIDLALALIEKHFDRATAERVARDTEYVWNDHASEDPFSDAGQKQVTTSDPRLNY